MLKIEGRFVAGVVPWMNTSDAFADVLTKFAKRRAPEMRPRWDTGGGRSAAGVSVRRAKKAGEASDSTQTINLSVLNESARVTRKCVVRAG